MAVILYGALSSPTPDVPGRREALIGLLLVLAVGIRQPIFAFTGARALDRDAPSIERVGAIALPLMFWIPLLRGLATDSEPAAIVRDVVPLLYLFAPVLFSPLLARNEDGQRLLAAALAVAGVLFASRFFAASGLEFGEIGRLTGSDRLLYLANSPSVLFAAIALGVFAFRPNAFTRPFSLAMSGASLAGSLLCLAALAGTVQRGPLMLAAAAFLLAFGWRARQSAVALVFAPVLVAALTFAAYEPIAGTVALIQEKTALVGGNARVDEFAAVLEQVGRDPMALLFGDGWGALVASPAVGGLRVGYTHTFLGYVLLKSGLVGVAVLTAYFAVLLRAAATAVRFHPMLALAILPPLTLGTTVTTSFKFLDFGLLLVLLCAAHARRAARSESTSDRLLQSKRSCYRM